MKKILTASIFLALCLATSCSTIRVAADYDQAVNFKNYKTFAFSKTGIDKAEISDLDKRRILRAIEATLKTKGLTKSETPDLLVSLFTKSQQRVDVYNNSWGYGPWGYGLWGFNNWGWGPWGNTWGRPAVSTNVEGTLYIDLIDAKNKTLIWQGMGTGYLTQNVSEKDARIREFVNTILEQYPPGIEMKH